MKNKGISPIILQSIKETNYKSILYMIEESSKISRTEISNITALSPATVTNACDKLLNAGYIREISRGFSLSGRKPIFLEINPDGGEVIGVIIYKNMIRVAISNLKSEIISCSSQKITDDSSIDSIVSSLIEAAIFDYKPKNILGIGVTVEWIYDFASRKSLPNHNINEEHLKKLLEDKFAYPVCIEKYPDLCALAESSFYYAGAYNNLLYLNFDDELSAGVIVNNTILKNPRGNINNVSHLNFRHDGPPCACGRNGCAHSYCSTKALVQNAIHGVISNQSRELPVICNNNLNNIDEFSILEAIKRGDNFCNKILDDFTDYIITFMDTLSQLYFPEIIILGGKINIFKDILPDLIMNKIKLSNYSAVQKCIIDFSHFNEFLAIKGICKATSLYSFLNLNLEEKG